MKTVKELSNLNQEELTKILKVEGNIPCENPKYNEWLDIFELMRMCRRSELSELETWCVLRGRFEIDRKTIADKRNENIESLMVSRMSEVLKSFVDEFEPQKVYQEKMFTDAKELLAEFNTK